MRYAEFRDQLEGALREEGLFFAGADRRVEMIDLENTVRHWKAYVHRTTPANAEPFHVFAAIEFDWSPVDAARAYTCEEDLLTEFVGRRTRLPRTERRWTRVDLSLHATLPYGSTTSIPERHAFGGWTAAVVEKVDAAFTHVEEKGGRVVAVLGGHGDLEVQSALQPRRLGLLERRRDLRLPHGSRATRLGQPRATRVGGRPAPRARTGWREPSKRRLTTGRRVFARSRRGSGISPPPPGAKPIEPWFDDEAEDDDDGPETTH